MKKLLFLILFFCGINCNAQVNTKLMTCNGSGFPFTVQFSGNVATATFKGYAHTVPYIKVFIGKNGDTWFVYQSQTLDISTTPYDNYVALYKPNTGVMIADGFCK